jgi:hypothetical protein
VYFPPADLKKVKAAAARADLSVSSFVVRACRAAVGEDDATSRLLAAPAFRGALCDVMSRPSVVAELADRLKLAKPAQLEMFRAEMKRGLNLMVGGKG